MNFFILVARLPVNSWTTQAKDSVGVGMTGQEDQRAQAGAHRDNVLAFASVVLEQLCTSSETPCSYHTALL